MESQQPPDWDGAGVLSIVVQGGLADNTIAETAAHCVHWRDLFPNAEIVLSISSSNILNLPLARQQPCRLVLSGAFRNNSQIDGSLSLIKKACNKIVFAEDALPLPPIKSDSPKLNNANFQIAAAKAGLAVASGTYILRVRSDFIFLDRSFLRSYLEGQEYPRGTFAVFRERLLISQLFTVNPFTIERMPFHYSDWFHLGPAAAVRDYWNAPPMRLRDAIHYEVNSHRKGSYASERLFNTRLAVEQHIAFSCFSRHFPSLVLAQHNDLTHVEEAMSILRDNFIVCDIAATNGVMPKYRAEMHDPKQSLVCVTEADWKRLAAAPAIPAGLTLVDKILEVEAPASYESKQSFPRVFPACKLRSNIARLLHGHLVAYETSGVAMFGPHATLNAGNYVARVHVSTLAGAGKIMVAVTSASGLITHGERTFHIKGNTLPKLEVVFPIPDDGARDVECVVTLDGIREFAASGMEINDLDADADGEGLALDFPAESLSAKEGQLVGGELVATTSQGLISHGPYTTVKGGSYFAQLKISAARGSGSLVLRVTLENGDRTIAERRIPVRNGRVDPAWIPFNISGAIGQNLEVLCLTEGVADVRIAGLTIASAGGTRDVDLAPGPSEGGSVSHAVRGIIDRLVGTR